MRFKLFGLIFDLTPLLMMFLMMWSGFAILGATMIDVMPDWYAVFWGVSTLILVCVQGSLYGKLEKYLEDK